MISGGSPGNSQHQNRPVDGHLLKAYLGHRLRWDDSIAHWITVVMARDPSLTQEEAALLRIEVLRQLADELAAYTRGGARALSEQPSAGPTIGTVSVPLETETEASPYALARLPLGEAILKHLRDSKEPQSTKQIWRALEAAGRESASEKPEQSISWALRKLVVKNDDVFNIRWGRWHLKSKYKTKKQKEKLAHWLQQNIGTGGRSTDEHRARTKAGIDAWVARGGKPGARVKVTPELVEQAKDLLRSGIGLKDVATQLGISVSSLVGRKINARELKKEGRAQTDGSNVVIMSPRKASNE
jgi:hypothetical protein